MDLIFPQMAIFANQPLVYLVGESRRQGRLTPPFRASLLDCGFPGVFSSLHPDTNP